MPMRAIAERSGLKGDEKLAEITTKLPAANAYFHSGHGAEDLYEGDKLNTAKVPNKCAYVTAVESGRISFIENERAKEFLRQWNAAEKEKDLRDMFNQITLPNGNALGDAARAHIQGIFAVKSDKSYDDNLVEFSLAKESFVSGIVMPILSWHVEARPATATRSAQTERYYAKPSGLQPQGVNLLDPIEIDDGVITEDHIRKMYENSVFPTAKEILEDSVLKYVLGKKFKNAETGEMEPNYTMVVDYIDDEWTCSSIALMRSFPGAHYHMICRVPMSNSQQSVFRSAPKRKFKKMAQYDMKGKSKYSYKIISNLLIPKLLRGDEWKELGWRHFSDSESAYDDKGEIPPIYPPEIGRNEGPMSWTEGQRHWAMKELQYKKQKELKEEKLKEGKRATKKAGRRFRTQSRRIRKQPTTEKN